MKRNKLFIVYILLFCFTCATKEVSEVNLLDDIFEEASHNENLRSLIVFQDGQIVKEQFFIDDAFTSHDVRSVTKSVVATLTGIAINRGFIPTESESIGSYLTPLVNEIAPEKATIKIKDILSMASGISGDELANPLQYIEWYNAPNQLEFTLSKPMDSEPGSKFTYNSGLTHIMAAVLTQATDTPLKDFANEHLFNPLNIQNVDWQQDNQGIYNGGAGLKLTPYDMLKIGRLYLNNGVYDTAQIVSSDWVVDATSFKITTESSQPFGPDYGYYWWIGNTNGLTYYFANGYGGQFIVIVPDINLIVVATNNWSGIPTATANEQWYTTLSLIISRIIPLQNSNN